MLLLLVGTVLEDGIHHQRALHRDETAEAGIAALEFLHDQSVFDIGHAGATVAFEIGAEKTKPSQLQNHLGRKPRVAEAVADEWYYAVLDELARRLPHQQLLLVK